MQRLTDAPPPNLHPPHRFVSKTTGNNVALSLLLSTSQPQKAQALLGLLRLNFLFFHQHVRAVRLILFRTPALTSARCCFIIHYHIFIHCFKFCSNYAASHNILVSKWLIFTAPSPTAATNANAR